MGPSLSMPRRRTWLVPPLLMSLLLSAGVAAASHQAAGTLPGGTSIEVSIDDPASGSTFLVPAGGTADVTVSGQASVGEGVPAKDTTVAYAVDVSASMSASAGTDCTGDAVNDNRLTCAKVGIAAANQHAADPFSAIGLTGLASYESAATSHVVDLAPGGTAILVAPDHDGNTNGTFDLEEVANSLALGFQTNYAAGLQAAVNILNDAANTSTTNVILFLSDADTSSVMVGAHISTVAIPANTTIHTFGVGAGPSCAFDGGTGSLNDIAALSTGEPGSCQIVTDMSELADFITDSLGSSLDTLEIAVDGGAASTIPNADTSLPLPQGGPATVTYSTEVTGLAPGEHEICVTASGTDAGGSGSVTACITVNVVIEVGLDIKPNSDPNSINTTSAGRIAVAILGSALFDVTEVDTSSLTFGATGDEDSLSHCGGLEDVNADGFDDLVCHFFTQATGLSVGDTVGILKGTTLSGDPFQATDAVRIVK